MPREHIGPSRPEAAAAAPHDRAAPPRDLRLIPGAARRREPHLPSGAVRANPGPRPHPPGQAHHPARDPLPVRAPRRPAPASPARPAERGTDHPLLRATPQAAARQRMDDPARLHPLPGRPGHHNPRLTPRPGQHQHLSAARALARPVRAPARPAHRPGGDPRTAPPLQPRPPPRPADCHLRDGRSHRHLLPLVGQ